MRSDTEIINLILNIAGKDEQIRAVYMNDSRMNANVPKDTFQNYARLWQSTYCFNK